MKELEKIVDSNGEPLEIVDAEAREDISEIKQSFSNLVVSTEVEGTTSSSGALAIPAFLYDIAIIDQHYIGGNVGLVFRRDREYFTCCDNNRNTLANTAVKIRVFYINN